MGELDFSKDDYDEAATSQHATRLELLSHHPSRYVRARIMGNQYTPFEVRTRLRLDYSKDSGLLSWLFLNPAFTREEFVAIYREYIGRSYESMVHSGLAASSHATIDELATLLRLGEWLITLSVVNNYQHRNQNEFRLLIKDYCPVDDKPSKQWTELERIAYLRTFGKRQRHNGL